MQILSGIQPSGVLHIGNYLGVIKQHIALQDEYEQPLYFIADLHAITIPQDPKALRQRTLNAAAMYLALGLDPEKGRLFVQSHVQENTELSWILTTIATMGELERMTQFKEKGRGEDRGSNGVGLFSYPLLMAADILLYDAGKVPIGDDQVQHLELARDLAKRFNQRFGETFVIPSALLPTKENARIMALDDATVKMSKSATSAYNYLALTDDADTIRNKIKKAVTDSGGDITYADDRPALKNLLTIFSGVTGETTDTIVERYSGKGYADFKSGLAEALIEFLSPIQDRYQKLLTDESNLIDILHAGAAKARPIAEQTLEVVKEKVGFVL